MNAISNKPQESTGSGARPGWLHRLLGSTGRRVWLCLSALVLGALAVTLGLRPHGATDRTAKQPGAEAGPIAMQVAWGIDRVRVVRSAAGNLLDLRYRVVDPQKAAPLLARDSKAFLVHEATGARVGVPSMPKTGPLRNSGKPEPGRIYFALFSNPGGVVKHGDRVSVGFGDALLEDLVVE